MTALTPPIALGPIERAHIAARWAPTFYQETRDERDLITSFDFDGDWDGSNNAAHLRSRRYPLPAIVYYTVAETATHLFITYVPYHPVDAKVPSGHDHDTEHATLVVRKDAPDGRKDASFGRVEAMEVRFHSWMYQYAAPGVKVDSGADDIDGPIHFAPDGRPELYVQRVGHGVCGGFAPPTWFNALALTCRHDAAPHVELHGVVYHYTGKPGVARSLDDRDVGYSLVEIGDTLWAHAHESGPHATFASLIDFHGERCGFFQCPRGFGGVLAPEAGHGSTGMPWEERGGRGVQSRGAAFFDPAYTLGKRLRFPLPYSTDYLFNPYLSIGEFASGTRAVAASGGLAKTPSQPLQPPPSE